MTSPAQGWEDQGTFLMALEIVKLSLPTPHSVCVHLLKELQPLAPAVSPLLRGKDFPHPPETLTHLLMEEENRAQHCHACYCSNPCCTGKELGLPAHLHEKLEQISCNTGF